MDKAHALTGYNTSEAPAFPGYNMAKARAKPGQDTPYVSILLM